MKDRINKYVAAVMAIVLVSSLVYTHRVDQRGEARYLDNLMETYSLGAFRPSNYVGKLLTRLNEGGSESTFNTTPETAADDSTLTTAKLGDFIVFTINPGGANEEKISASAVSVTGSTATWTIINRGLSFTENAVITANKTQHAIGEVVIISNDDHYLSQQFVSVDDTQTITGIKTVTVPWTFSQLPILSLNATTSLQAVNKAVLDASVNQGSATSTFTNGGIIEKATAAEQAAGTDGGVDKPLALVTEHSTSTPGTPQSINANKNMVALATGFMSQAWIDLTAAFTTSGAWVFNSTVDIECDAGANMTLNGVAVECPSAQGSDKQFIQNNGSGVWSWQYASGRLDTQTTDVANPGDTTTTTAYSLLVPANTLGTAGILRTTLNFDNYGQGGGAPNFFFIETGYGNSTTTATMGLPAAGISGMSGSVVIELMGAGATNSQEMNIIADMGTTGNANGNQFTSATGGPAIDSTTAKALTVLIWFGQADGDSDYNISNRHTEIIR